MMNRLTILIMLVTLASSANASLINRGNGLIYDTVQNLTWVQDPLAIGQIGRHPLQTFLDASGNPLGPLGQPGPIGQGAHAVTTLTPDGRVNFGDLALIGNLNILNYKGFGDWRRPTSVGNSILQTTGNSVDGELANLFRDNANALSIFQNVLGNVFWAGTQQFTNGTQSNNSVLAYDVTTGNQFITNRRGVAYDFLVRTGDVATVPLPPAVWTFISGLLMLLLGFKPLGLKELY